MLLEDFREPFHAALRRARESSGALVHRDEVHMEVRGPAQLLDALCELGRVLLRVVHPREQHVLEGHAPFGPRDVPRGGGEDLVDVPALV